MKLPNRFLVICCLAILSTESFAWGEEYFCTMAEVKNSKCQAGDLLYVPSPQVAIRFCDFTKKVVAFSNGDASDINAAAVCYYFGKERMRK